MAENEYDEVLDGYCDDVKVKLLARFLKSQALGDETSKAVLREWKEFLGRETGLAYLREVWGYKELKDLTASEAACVLENAHNRNYPSHPHGYPDDQALWNLYAELHGLPTWDKMDPVKFLEEQE